jgi:CheY-like chemotaxis protein
MAEKKRISIQFDQTDQVDQRGIPRVSADRTRFWQIVLNLLSNAIKYNDEGGSVSVSREVVDGLVRISVKDNGHGIPAQFMEKLFEPFNRLAAEGSRGEGTGIGLSITRQLVELMDGAIDCASIEGEGTTFWFDLPISVQRRETLGPASNSEASNSEAPNSDDATAAFAVLPGEILYIEDNPANMQLMQMIIGEFEELDLQIADTAESGLDIAAASKPDLIFMDINLPGISGIDALKKLRANPATKDTPVVAVSANAMAGTIESALAEGFNA